MRKLLLLFFALLTSVSAAWAESKLSKAVAGTYLFDSSSPALTVNKGGATVTNSGGTITIHHDNLSTVTGNRTYAAVVMKVDMPTTAPGSFSQFINLQSTSGASDNSIGLGVTTDGKLKGTWKAGAYGPETTSAVTGVHTIVLLCNDGGTTIYVDNSSTYVNNSGLKCATQWTDLRIESAYASCVKSVYVFSGEQNGNIAAFFSELSNVVTVANGETESVSDNSTATRFFVASGGTLTADVDYDADKIEVVGNVEIVSGKTLTVNAAWFDLTKITGAGNVTLDIDATISGNKSTVATGKLTISEGKTLTLGGGDSQTNSIASFTSIELAGTFKLNNSKATLNGVTVPTSKTGKIFAYDMGNEANGFNLAGTTTLTGNLVVCSKYNFQMKVDALAGSGDCLICGTTGDNYDASGTSSNETATINIASASTYTGGVTVNNSKATVNVSGNLVGSSWTKTNGTLKYAGANLNGTTLDGAILAGSSRITTSNTVNIKNLAGNNLNSTDHLYAFVGGGTINFYGTCDLTKKSDGTGCNSANIGYGSSASVIIKAGANVTAGVVLNSATLSSNALITVEATATLTCVGSTHVDNATLLIYSKNLTNNGTINLNGANRTSQVSALSGSGTLNVASGSTITAPSVPSTMTLTGAGDVVLTTFPSSTAPTLSSWTGAIEFPANGSASNITGIFNAWGNENSTIKLNNVSGHFSQTSKPVNPTLNILEGKTLTINNGYSSYPPVLSKLTGNGSINLSWTGGSNYGLTIQNLTDFDGTLQTTNYPITVTKLVLETAPAVNDLLIKTSGTVTLSKLYINSEETTAYSWETKTVDEVKGIYISEIDEVQLNREMAVAAVSPYKDYIGTGVGMYTVSLDETSYTSFDDFETAVDVWEEVGDCVVPTITLNEVPAGFYRFNIGTNYMCNVAGGDNVRTATTTSDDASTIFYLNASNYLIAYADGYGFNWAYCKATEPSIFNGFEFSESPTIGKYLIHALNGTGNASNRYLTINESTSKLDAGQGAWTITEVTSLPVTIGSSGYATLYSPVALEVPEGVTAFWGENSAVDNAILVHAINAGEVIPANNGVVLYTTTPETYGFDISTESGSISGTNVITGTVTTKARSGEYTLQNGSEGIAFYADAVTNLQGFKAYLPSGSSSVMQFVFDEETVVKAIEAAMNPGKVVYDMNGRRVENPSKGLYIVNGKKVIIK